MIRSHLRPFFASPVFVAPLFRAALAFSCLVLVPLATVHSQESGLVMVVGKSSATSALTPADAKKILLGETNTWRNGEAVLVVMKPPGSPERAAILKRLCGMTETIYTRYELQASFTGQVAAHVSAASSGAAVKATLAANPSAIGFLQKSEVDSSVKVVLTLD